MSKDEAAPESDLPPELGLPIEHLFMVDPLDLTVEDLSLIATHYRNNRLNFLKLEAKPKAVEKSRGPKLTAEETSAKMESILSNLIGSGKQKPPPKAKALEPDPEEIEEDEETGDDD